MHKNVTRIRIILIGSFSLITIGSWIGAEIYHQLLHDTISPEYESQISSLDPHLPIEVLDQIENKNSLSVDLNQIDNILLPTPTPPPSDGIDLNFTAPASAELDSTADTIETINN